MIGLGPTSRVANVKAAPPALRMHRAGRLRTGNVNGPLKNAFFHSSRGNEAQISLETIIRLEPPDVLVITQILLVLVLVLLISKLLCV